MNVLISGASGFVGGHLSRALLKRGWQVTGLGTSSQSPLSRETDFTWIQADTTRPGDWQIAVPAADIIINLAGRTIFKRWSKAYKQQLVDSRVRTTRNLVAALPQNSSAAFLSTSAVGYYGNRGEDVLTEETTPGEDFLADLSVKWEDAARTAGEKGARVAVMRFGIVLAADGGALSKMVPAFRMFAGGPVGDGRHWFPWIHMADLIGAIELLINRKDLEGPFNFVAPNPMRNGDFARTLGKVLGRPAMLPAPAFMLRLLMGEVGGVLLSSQRAMPNRLEQVGYQFKFPSAERALADILL